MHFFSVVAIAVFATFIPAIGTAQTVTFDALSKYVDVGDLVTVTAADGTRSSGRITALTGLSLELKVDSGNAWFSGSTLRRAQVNDSLANGSIIGLVAGAVPGAIVGNLFRQLCYNETGRCDAAPFVAGAMFGAIGAGVGAGIDAMIRRVITMTDRNQPIATMSPVVEPHRQVLLVSLRF